jgi:tetratricopeptide (TPR) repeat protein
MNDHALTLYGQGRLSLALSMAWQTVNAHPSSAVAQHTYANLLRESGDERTALAVANEGLRVNPWSADLLVLRGDLHRSLSGFSVAEADYAAALQRNPRHPLAIHNLAVSRLRWGHLTEAVGGFVDAARLDTELAPLALSNIGLALTRILRLATSSVVFLAVPLIVLGAAQQDPLPTVLPRIFAALLTLPLIAAVVWTVRTVPHSTLRAVLLRQWLLAARLVFLVVAIIAGLFAATTGLAAAAGTAGALMLFGVVAFTVLGWIVGT